MLTKRQEEVVTILLYFAPEMIFNIKTIPEFHDIIEHKDGLEAKEAYFRMTDRGERILKVSNIQELAKLYYGHKRYSLNIANWKKGFKSRILFPTDFINEPEYIVKLAKKCFYEVGKTGWDEAFRLKIT
jgi:hypothetical protein